MRKEGIEPITGTKPELLGLPLFPISYFRVRDRGTAPLQLTNNIEFESIAFPCPPISRARVWNRTTYVTKTRSLNPPHFQFATLAISPARVELALFGLQPNVLP